MSMIGPRTACTRLLLVPFIGGLVDAGGSMTAVPALGRDHALVEHINAKADERDRPIADDLAEANDFQIVQQEQETDGDQEERSYGKLRRFAAARENAREFIHRLAE